MPQPSPDFERVVDRHYAEVYRFALSLAKQPAVAADLTQETFLRYAQRGSQLRDLSKVRSWLMTTLFREFNQDRRHSARFPTQDLAAAEDLLPTVDPEGTPTIDADFAMAALSEVDEVFRAVLALFYLEDFSYQEIAEILDVPLGTVMSRLSRGKSQLRSVLVARMSPEETRAARVIRFPSKTA